MFNYEFQRHKGYFVSFFSLFLSLEVPCKLNNEIVKYRLLLCAEQKEESISQSHNENVCVKSLKSGRFASLITTSDLEVRFESHIHKTKSRREKIKSNEICDF